MALRQKGPTAPLYGAHRSIRSRDMAHDTARSAQFHRSAWRATDAAVVYRLVPDEDRHMVNEVTIHIDRGYGSTEASRYRLAKRIAALLNASEPEPTAP
jgi:hypothetical protein